MKHAVTFENCENHWDNALPLGNGVFGCMLFFEDGRLFMPYNHYEVYYNHSEHVLPADILASKPPCSDPGAAHRATKARADGNQPGPGEAYVRYNASRTQKRTVKAPPLSGSYPQTGELVFSFAPRFAEGKSRLTLFTEDADVRLALTAGEESVTADTVVLRRDCIVNTFHQSSVSAVKGFEIVFHEYRDAEPPVVSFRQADEQTVVYTVRQMITPEKEFPFAGVIRACGARLRLRETRTRSCFVEIEDASTSFSLQTVVKTGFQAADPAGEALCFSRACAAEAEELKKEHQAYWDAFFSRTKIDLPDKFLEKVYYINQYAMDCCIGKDGVMKHHACGLNGLWDIRRPNLWGSMWYWDVNIQAALAGAFSGNRPDWAKAFSDGLLSYRELAARFAHDMHDKPGCASDYPYPFYYACFAWCAQYLWYYYEYTLDEEYLRKEAYPLFLELCAFMQSIFEWDEAAGVYTVYPDISPEQGPLAHNTVITVACAKYLFAFTLKSSQILGESSEITEKCREMLKKMPEYPVCEDSVYGRRLKDSPDAPENLWLRHPSLLMPVFPIGEEALFSDPAWVSVIGNTLDYLEENCEIGVFQGSWLAASAARIGRGQFAGRVLYERGIDHLLRSNGLTAESTDRFMNFCLMNRQPLYYPCMTEFTGEMLAAVNEMLLQSFSGVITVFPALPDGDPEYGRMIRGGFAANEADCRFIDYPAWKDVRFDRLLAKGAFEVSAILEDGRLRMIAVFSRKGGKARVTSPFLDQTFSVFSEGRPVPFTLSGSEFRFETEAGKEYRLLAPGEDAPREAPEEVYDDGLSRRMTFTKRIIRIGENEDDAYRKLLDAFLRDSYLGNTRIPNHTVYKFDFSEEEKDYAASIPLQAYAGERFLLRGSGFICLGTEAFTPRRGFGFADASGITLCKRSGPDVLRRDFAEGDGDASFIIELPRGQYELLVIAGDADEDSCTAAWVDNARRIGGSVVQKGRFTCGIIPFIHEKDGPLALHLATLPGYKWKLNALLLNSVRGF